MQLRHLDEQETVENTMETKDKILKIFSSVDQSFQGVEDKTPFMLLKIPSGLSVNDLMIRLMLP